MTNNKQNNYNPHMGKPSDNAKETRTGLRGDMPPEELDREMDMTDKYTEDDKAIATNVHELHHNRNLNKGENYKLRQDSEDKYK